MERAPASPSKPPARPSAHGMSSAAKERAAFLSRPESYGASVTAVDAIETHMSRLFLTAQEAWKLKKPVRASGLDLTTTAARRRNAEQELMLNRRLAPDVYREVVALRRKPDGTLQLDGTGPAVDWLVRMRRLPGALMLDRMLAQDRVSAAAIDALVAVLCRFHATAERVAITPDAYVERFRAAIDENERELADARYDLPLGEVHAVHAQQRAALAACDALLRSRAAEGRVVEAHGDLRPEHVCLESPPVVIDCLDFSRALRELDPADEIAFLALECERLGAPVQARMLLERYCAAANDPVAPALLDFYASFRAGVRARLAIHHLADPALRQPKWRTLALTYLQLAQQHLARRDPAADYASSNATIEPSS